jgi:Protein of unknown function (DUF2911)
MHKSKILILLIAIFLLMQYNIMAQINIPSLSPSAKIEQQIGLASVSISYARPSLRCRKLLGQANIPYNTIWRMGANEVTTLTLSKDVLIANQHLAKGKYAFVAIPNDKEWTIIINKDSDQWGVYDYNSKKDVLRFNIKVDQLASNIETLTFSFEDIKTTSANIVFRWENIQLQIPILHDVETKVLAEIKVKTSVEKINEDNAMMAAEYYLMQNINLEQALIWSDYVLARTKSPFRYNLKAQIAEKLGKCEIAIEASKNAIVYANKNGDKAAIALAETIIKNCLNK